MHTYVTPPPCGLNELNGLGFPDPRRAPAPGLCPPDCPYRPDCPNRPRPEPVCPPPAPYKKSACDPTVIALALACFFVADRR